MALVFNSTVGITDGPHSTALERLNSLGRNNEPLREH
jgi:hypothetical protein